MKYKMLIAEDNKLMAELLAHLFDGLGFETTIIDDGGKVLPFLDQLQVDVIILDLQLPHVTGDQIYIAIKRNPVLCHIPIIPFTAYSDSKVPGSMPSILTCAAWDATKDQPHIVPKPSASRGLKEMQNELIAEVLTGLTQAGKPPTLQLAEWYTRQSHLKLADKK